MSLVVLPRQIVIDQNGKPRVGAKMYVYNAGTNNPRVSYTTSAYSIPHPHPIPSPGGGYFPAIYVDATGGDYKVVITDADDNPVWTEDNLPVRDRDFDQVAVAQVLLPQSNAERDAGITPFNYAYPPGDIRRYGAVGTVNDSSTMNVAIAQCTQTGAAVLIPRGVTVNARDIALGDGVKLEIDGELVGVTGGTSLLTVATGNDHVRVCGTGRINTNGLQYGILSTGAYTVVDGLTFLGHVLGSYCKMAGHYADVINCRILPAYDCSNIPFLFAGEYGARIKRPRFLHNRLEDVRGFNVSFRYCEDFQCIDNSFDNPTYTYSTVAVGSQTVFTNVDLAVNDIDRWACTVNGVQSAIAGTPTNAGALYSITLSVAAPNSAVVVFYGSRSLENMQANSECIGGIFSDNVCNGTGDSNIVVGGDYHNGAIHPTLPGSDVVASDYPASIIVQNNICRLAFASSINMSQAIGGTIGGNDCSTWGLRQDTASGPFYSAIFVGGNIRVRVDANTLHADEGATTRIQYGVGGWVSSTDTSAEDFRKRSPARKIAKQNFLGVYTAHYFVSVGGSGTERKYDMALEEGDWVDYPGTLQALFDPAQSVAGIVNSDTWWDNAVVDGPTPVTRDTTNKLGGTASAQLVATKSFRAIPLAKNILQYSLMKVSFWAYNSGADKGNFRIYYDNGDNDGEPHLKVTVQSTGWEQYEILVPITVFGTQGLFFRFYGPAAGTTNFQHVRLAYKPLNIL